MPVNDLAREDVVTAASDTPISELASKMEESGVGSVVITSGKKPVGIVTDRDLALRALKDGQDPFEMVAEDVMSTELHTISPDTGFYEAADIMAEHGVRRLIVSHDDTLDGIIAIDDLTELFADEQEQLADVIRAQRPAY